MRAANLEKIMLVSHIKDIVRPFVNKSHIGRAARHYFEPAIKNALGMQPVTLRIPRSWRESISDAFVWRCDDGFRTRFDLMNLSSFIVPDRAAQERVLIVLFSQKGSEIKRQTYDLEPFEIHTIYVDELLSEDDGKYGTFCVFHERHGQDEEWNFETCILERSYTSYKNQDQCDVWSYVHGCCNSYVLSYDFSKDRSNYLCQRAAEKQIFRPQLRFDDCGRFEIFFSNPLNSAEELTLKVYDSQGDLCDEISHNLESLSCQLVSVDNSQLDKARIELESHIYMGRPLLFKYYASHFDVLHS